MIENGVARRWFPVVSGWFAPARDSHSARQNVWFGDMEAPKTASDPILLRLAFRFAFRSRFGLVSGSFWVRFWSVVGPFWLRFGSVLGSFSFRFRFVFISFSVRLHFVFSSFSFRSRVRVRVLFVFVSLSCQFHFAFVCFSFSFRFRFDWTGWFRFKLSATEPILIRATSGVSIDR